MSLQLDRTPPDLDLSSAETTVKYAGYLRRQEEHVARGRAQRERCIPDGFRYDRLPGLSREAVQRLTEARPETLDQAGRVPGVTPAAVSVIAAHLDR